MDGRGQDKALASDSSGAGNLSSTATYTFTIDNTPPVGAITWPTANAAVSSATIHVTGTESDDLAGVQTTQVEISTGLGRLHTSYLDAVPPGPVQSQTWITTSSPVTSPWFYNAGFRDRAGIGQSFIICGVGFSRFRRQSVHHADLDLHLRHHDIPTVNIAAPVNGKLLFRAAVHSQFLGRHGEIDNGTNLPASPPSRCPLQDMTARPRRSSNVPAGVLDGELGVRLDHHARQHAPISA